MLGLKSDANAPDRGARVLLTACRSEAAITTTPNAESPAQDVVASSNGGRPPRDASADAGELRPSVDVCGRAIDLEPFLADKHELIVDSVTEAAILRVNPLGIPWQPLAEPRYNEGMPWIDRGSLRDHGIGPNENVYVSLDEVWAHLITRPGEAQHVLGKLLKYVGEDNILWATDSVFYGVPHPQVEAFRDFEIPAQMQEQYGYPELTAERKAKIFGFNAARLFCLQPL